MIAPAATATPTDDQGDQRGQEAQVRDQEGRQAQHEGRRPPRHRQQEIARRREHQRTDQPAPLPSGGVGRRGGGEQHRRQRLDDGLGRELAGEFAPAGTRGAVTTRNTP